MIKIKIQTAAVLLTLGLLSLSCHPRKSATRTLDLTYALQQLTNIQSLAESPAGQAGMISSYDRSGGNQDWARDRRTPAPDGLVDIARLNGPGAIHRIWMTGQDPSNWSIFIDDEKAPHLTLFPSSTNDSDSVQNAFATLYDTGGGGHTYYMPIPFKQSIRFAVPADYQPGRPYFQINYTLYPKNTKVTSLPATLFSVQVDLLQKIKEQQRDTATLFDQVISSCAPEQTLELAPRESAIWLNRRTPGTLEAFWFELPTNGLPTALKSEWLKELILRIYWDGQEAPAYPCLSGIFSATPSSSGNTGPRRWPINTEGLYAGSPNGLSLIHRLNPKLLFMSNSMGTPINQLLVKYAAGRGIPCVTLVSEGNFHKDPDRLQAQFWGWNKERIVYENLQLLWSTRALRYILDLEPQLKDKLKVSGGSGFDLYKIHPFISRSAFLERYHNPGYTKVIGIGCWDFGRSAPKGPRYQTTLKRMGMKQVTRFQEDGRAFNRIMKELVKRHPDTCSYSNSTP